MNQPIKLVAKGVGKKKSLREKVTTNASLTTTVPPVKTWGILQFTGIYSSQGSMVHRDLWFTGIHQAFLVDKAQKPTRY